MSAQHTPGPWRLTAPNHIFYIRGANGEYILARDSKQTYDKEAAARIGADCALIAAAPELLEALKLIAFKSGNEEIIKIARVAIGKAVLL